MASNTFIQNVYYHYILTEPSLAMNFNPEFFSAKPLQVAFRIAKDYVIKYHDAPSAEQMKELVKLNDLSNDLSDDIIDVLYAQKSMLSNYSPEWLRDEATNWAILENVKKAIVDAAAYLKLNQDDMESGKAKDIVEHIKTMFNRTCVLDFDDCTHSGSDFWNASSHSQEVLQKRSTGFPFIDFCLNGGWFDGSLICFVGAPKVGKSLWLQNLCAESVKRGDDTVYISLELAEALVTSRIGSNILSIPSLEYDSYVKRDDFADKLKSARNSSLIEPGELLIRQFPTSSLTVVELEAFLLKEEEKRSYPGKKFKFKNVFLDYLNIMRNYRNPNSENTYMKIKQIAEDLRAMAIKNDWCIVTATQTNRTQFDSNDILTNQVSESSALGATVDAMFGIIADPLMKSQGKYYLKCMYDRVSPQENKKKLYDCNFNFLRLSENVEEGIIEVSMFPGDTDHSSNKFVKANAQKKNGTQVQQVFPKGEVDATIQPNTEFDLIGQAGSPAPANTIQPTVIPMPCGPTIKYTGQGIF